MAERNFMPVQGGSRSAVKALRIVVFGSTGQTGRIVVRQALDAGHEVSAFVRDPASAPFSDDRVRVVPGDVLDAASVDRAVQAQEAVLSALGVRSRRPPPVLSQGIRNILEAMGARGVRRLVVMSAAGAMHEDAGFFAGKVALGLGHRMLRGVYLEHGRMLREIQGSDREWTAIRPMLLTNGPHTGRYRVAIDGLPRGGLRISRADVADFMLRQLASGEYVRRMPAIAY